MTEVGHYPPGTAVLVVRTVSRPFGAGSRYLFDSGASGGGWLGLRWIWFAPVPRYGSSTCLPGRRPCHLWPAEPEPNYPGAADFSRYPAAALSVPRRRGAPVNRPLRRWEWDAGVRTHSPPGLEAGVGPAFAAVPRG